MNPAGELAQRLVELAPGFLEDVPRARLRSELRLQRPQVKRQRDQPLLRAVVQIALEPAPLGLSDFHDAGARTPQLLDPRTQLRLEAAVLERDSCRGDDGGEERRLQLQ